MRADKPPLRFETTKKAAVLFTVAGISLLVMAYNIGPITQALGSLVVESFDLESSSLQTNAEASVRQQLRDPASARFDTPFVVRSERFVCGYVNAKNGFGGYVGRQLYVYSGGSAVIMATDNHLRVYKDQISKCSLRALNQ